MKIKAVIFDLDGTLLDTVGGVAMCANLALEHFGKEPLKTDYYRSILGKGMQSLIDGILPDLSTKQKQEAREIIERNYMQKADDETKMFEGISKVLTYLQTNGIKMAILSNKPHKLVVKNVYKFLDKWDFVSVYGQMGELAKPDPAFIAKVMEEIKIKNEECLFVGDTQIDIQTGLNAKMDTIAVAWGFKDIKTLQNAGATYLANEPSDIIKIVNNLNTNG